jgi:hypothetical protein
MVEEMVAGVEWRGETKSAKNGRKFAGKVRKCAEIFRCLAKSQVLARNSLR